MTMAQKRVSIIVEENEWNMIKGNKSDFVRTATHLLNGLPSHRDSIENIENKRDKIVGRFEKRSKLQKKLNKSKLKTLKSNYDADKSKLDQEHELAKLKLARDYELKLTKLENKYKSDIKNVEEEFNLNSIDLSNVLKNILEHLDYTLKKAEARKRVRQI